LQQAWPDDFADHPLAKRMYPDAQERHWLGTMIDRQVQTALSSGMGRLFDGFAALLGVCTRNSFEAQAGMKLESLAFAAGEANPRDEQPLYGIENEPENGDTNAARLRELSFVPLVRWVIQAISKGMAVEEISARIHQEMAAAWAAVVKEAAARTGWKQVVLSGGVFCNQQLLLTLSARLRSQGLTVWRHRLVPANDGGLALGQAAVAAARLQNAERWAD
jgi:hydrogenase maturation protein HypF